MTEQLAPDRIDWKAPARESLPLLGRQVGNGIVRWLLGGPHGLISFAVVRILVGLMVVVELVRNFPDRHYLWGIGSTWQNGPADAIDHPFFVRLLFPREDPVAFDIHYVLTGVIAVVFILGWRTRFVTPLLVITWVGLLASSTVVNNSGDTVMRIALFFLCFADLSSRLSLDAVLRRRAIERGRTPRPRWWVATLVHNTALALSITQLVIIYVYSSIYKLQGPTWLDGTALYYGATVEAFAPHPWLSGLLLSNDLVIRAATWSSLAVQALFPFALLWRPSRMAALVIVTSMHLGIGVLMGLWTFSFIMISLDLLVIRDRSWGEAVEWARALPGRVAAWRAGGRATPEAPVSPAS